jgi:hypothetical protein
MATMAFCLWTKPTDTIKGLLWLVDEVFWSVWEGERLQLYAEKSAVEKTITTPICQRCKSGQCNVEKYDMD